MSALDLDALEALARSCDAAERAHDAAADAYEEIDRKLRKAPSDPALCGMERAAMHAWGDADTARESARDDLRERCYGDTILVLITRLRAAEARTAWQPIETAPIDGVDRLVCTEGGSYYIACLYAEDGWLTDDDGPERQVYPTHWQPLPAAPEAP